MNFLRSGYIFVYFHFLRFLRFFTSVSWGILPSTNLVDCSDNCYTSRIFSFFLFSIFFSLEFKKLFFFSVPSVLFCVLSALSCFLFKSAFHLFLFSDYSILSASPLCFITIQSVLFLLFVIFRVLYLIPIFHLLCASFCFLWTPSSLGQDPMIYLLSFFPSLFLFPLFSLC